MVDVEIYTVRNELNRLIDQGASLADLYELSVRLDRLILQHYIERGMDIVPS